MVEKKPVAKKVPGTKKTVAKNTVTKFKKNAKGQTLLDGSISLDGKENTPRPSITVSAHTRSETKDPKVVAKELQKAFDKLEEIVDNSVEVDDKVQEEYDKMREKLDKALIATLPDIIDSLKIGEMIDHTYLITGYPEWDGARVEAKLEDTPVTEALLAKLKKGFFDTEPAEPGNPVSTFTLLSITRSTRKADELLEEFYR